MHHWLVTMRGGEKVLEQLCYLFPAAPVYTLVFRPGSVSDVIQGHAIHESKLAYLPGARDRYRSYLPLFPTATRLLRLPDKTQLIISSDASVIKGVSYSAGMPHVCYCHSPPRYLWDQQQAYLEQTTGLGVLGRLTFRAVTPYVRRFDRRAAQRVTHFIANSQFVRQRIARCYRRDAEVIHPPVEVEQFRATERREAFYLLVTELVGYKRVDLAIKAFEELKRELIVIGDGPEAIRLKAAAPENVRFLGRQPVAIVRSYFERCRAFIHPQVEDFGITAVEAQAAGAPVIAYAEGGACESVIDTQTGLFFSEQTPEALREAIVAFENSSFSADTCRANAERFRPEIFRARLTSFLRRKLPELFA